jgi:hypothetical protein
MKSRLLLIAISLLTLGVSAIVSPAANATPVTGFNAGRIIDDAVFTNYRTMNTNNIQNFLNSKVPTCDTNGTKIYSGSTTRAQYGASRGNPKPFTCLKNYKQDGKSAAQIIYEASQDYKINPQVLLVLLQKEQGLITDDWPWKIQYRSATGYGCPDNADCSKSYYGFKNQVRWAAKMFRSIMNDSPTWYTPFVLGNNTIDWNPIDSCGSSTTRIENHATLALYSYTPYRPNQAALNAGYGTGNSCSSYGNRNFYLYFRDWFGSTQTSIAYGWDTESIEIFSDAGYTQKFTRDEPILTPGAKAYIRMKVRNVGYNSWDTSFTRLAPIEPRDRQSSFSDSSWISGNRVVGTTEASTPLGDSATFEFSVTAPNQAGTHTESFGLVAESRGWMKGPAITLTLYVTRPASPQATNNTLNSGQSLQVNQKLLSADTNSTLTVHPTDIVLRTDFAKDWKTNTHATNTKQLVMQSDGNLVLRSQTNQALWATNTAGNTGAKATLQTDGNLVVKSSTNSILWSSSTTQNPDGLNYVNKTMFNNREMYAGQKIETPDRRYKVTLQNDGNLVMRNRDNKVTWASRTAGNPNARLILQSDGNLVIRSQNNRSVWNTKTGGKGQTRLTLKNDGSLVLYTPSTKVAWKAKATR